jgi:hypothetical protein
MPDWPIELIILAIYVGWACVVWAAYTMGYNAAQIEHMHTQYNEWVVLVAMAHVSIM